MSVAIHRALRASVLFSAVSCYRQSVDVEITIWGHKSLTLHMFRSRTIVCLVCGLCLHAVGARVERSFSQSHSCVICLHKVAESFLDGLSVQVAHLVDAGNGREQVQAMFEDAMVDIGLALGLRPHDMMCVREIPRRSEYGASGCSLFTYLDLLEVGWTVATRVIHRSSFSVHN